MFCLTVACLGIYVGFESLSYQMNALLEIVDLGGIWKDLHGVAAILSWTLPGPLGLYGLIYGVVEISWTLLFIFIVFMALRLIAFPLASGYIADPSHQQIFESFFVHLFMLLEIFWIWKAEYWRTNYVYFALLLLRFIFPKSKRNILVIFIFIPIIFFFGKLIWFNYWLDDATDIWERYGIFQMVFLAWNHSIGFMILDGVHSILLSFLGAFLANQAFALFPLEVLLPTSLILFTYEVAWFFKWFRFWPSWVIFGVRIWICVKNVLRIIQAMKKGRTPILPTSQLPNMNHIAETQEQDSAFTESEPEKVLFRRKNAKVLET